jgi:hypothetical protein
MLSPQEKQRVEEIPTRNTEVLCVVYLELAVIFSCPFGLPNVSEKTAPLMPRPQELGYLIEEFGLAPHRPSDIE